MRVGPEHVLEAARVLRAALAPHRHRDWSVRAGDLTWSCRETLLHAADCWYAVELSSQSRDWLPPMLAWRAGLTPEEGLAALDAAAALLAAVMRGVPPEARGYHGQLTDAEGFAAMHCDEVLVHGYDIAMGLGVAFSPPPDLAARVRELTAGQGVDVIVEHVGTPVWQACFRSLKDYGRLVTCGVTAGHRVELHLGQVFVRALSIMGVGRGSPDDMRALLRLVALGRVRPVIHQRFPLREAVAAHHVLERSSFFGKVVLNP